MRKYTDIERLKAQLARFEKHLNLKPREIIKPREPGFILKYVNGKLLHVELIPSGRCDQHRAIFGDGYEVVAGMAEIDQEVRFRMPPRLSEYSL